MSVEYEWVSGGEGEYVWWEGMSVRAGALGWELFRHFWQRSSWPLYSAWPSASLPLRLENVPFCWAVGSSMGGGCGEQLCPNFPTPQIDKHCQSAGT